ncbi:MAG: metallophosphoesterase [Cyanobacteria bacterium J06642_12]
MSFTLAQITDTHLLVNPDADLRDLATDRTFRAVLEDVVRHRPDGLLLTGDLAEEGAARAYQQLVDAIAPLQLPTFWLPGNHDCLPLMRRILRPPLFCGSPAAIALGNWQLLLLDSVLLEARYGEGRVSRETLEWLEAELQLQRHSPTLIALHHHPVPTGIGWLDLIQLENANDFLALVGRHPQVREIVFGHVHLELHRQRGKTHFYGCPSTSHQVIVGAFSARSPGYRLLTLNPDGTHSTEVHRIPQLAIA